jgi:AbrB family looped-hinge helix DNA binding protein
LTLLNFHVKFEKVCHLVKCQSGKGKMIASKIGRRGQITIPRQVRRYLHLEEGDQLAFVFRGKEVLIQPLTQTLTDLRGSVPVSAPQDFAAIRRQVFQKRAGRAEDHGG